MVWVFVSVSVLVASGVGAYFYMNDDEPFDVLSDFKEIKSALRAYRSKNKGLSKGIENLKPYLSEDSKVKLERYVLSIDDQFLVPKKLPSNVDGNELASKVGGKSKYADGKLKLNFFALNAGKEPEAVIGIKPLSNITTTTKLEYSHVGSKAENQEFLKVEWENNEEYFEEEGVHVIKLRIMDKHFRWSEWTKLDLFVSEAKGFKSIHGAGGHIIAVHNNGKAFAYGDNSFGQLGNCTTQDNIKVEELVQVQRVFTVATGDDHTLFLKSDKKVFSAGKNDFGQLGHGDRKNSKIPKLAWGIDNITSVACGNGFSAAVTSDGSVYTWGQNEHICLGHSTTHFVDRPGRVEELENIKDIALGQNNAFAIGYDGNVITWGENNYGQLGLGYKSKSNVPSVSLLKDIKQIATGKGFVLAVTNAGKVLAVGLNNNHQLGFDGDKHVLFPMEIPGLKNIEKVVTKGEFCLALDQTGNVYSWGQFSPIDNDFSLYPLKSDELKYVLDIAATANMGYALLEDGKIYEFGAKYTHFRTLEFAEIEAVSED